MTKAKPELQHDVEIFHLKNYLTRIRESVGTTMFRNTYGSVNGVVKDITEDGNLSCVSYASFILVPFKLAREIHLLTVGFIHDIESCGWKKGNKLRRGSILVWAPKLHEESGRTTHHVGFYIGNGLAVSNNPDPKYRCPTMHPYEEFDGRKLIAIYSHPFLSR